MFGFFIDKRFSFRILLLRFQKLWASYGFFDIKTNKEGFYLFSFSNQEGASKVMEKGPWMIMGQAIFHKVWDKSFDFNREEFRAILIWVKLYRIPTSYWSEVGFSTIDSMIGNPLYADEITTTTKILDYAKICVEMKAGSPFPWSYKVQT